MSGRHDVVVIGAGAGGGAVSQRLTFHGLRVLLLEAGPRFDPARDYRLHRPDWELDNFPYKKGSQARVSFARLQSLNAAEGDLRSWSRVSGRLNRGDTRDVSGSGYFHVQGIGGSTLHFIGEAHRLNPASMRLKSDFGVGADWPLTYADLEPYYVTAERASGVAGPEDPGTRWRSEPYPLPPHRFCKASAWLAAAAAHIGMSWEANPRAALSRPYDGRPACNYCGNCGRGCPIGDKGSSDVTFIRHALETGRCEIRAQARVTGFELARNGMIRAVRYVQGGRSERAEAPVVVLAAGAIETPRLLLANRSRGFPRGLANGSGQVGCNLLETLQWISTGFAAEPLRSYAGLPADAICWDYNRPDAIPDVIGGCRLSSATLDGGLAGPIAYASRIVPGFGAGFKQALRDGFGRALSVGAIGEFLPNAETYVDLDPVLRDGRGTPLARIHSRLTDMDAARLRFMAGRCRALLRGAGVEEPAEEFGTWDFFASTHVFGTCRMGTDPDASVVDAHGRAHECPNLYVADASVFPSSGGGEAPSLTIHALALRTADRIAGAAMLPPSRPPTAGPG